MDVKTLDVLQNKIQAIHDDQRLKLELTQIGERFKNELASTLDGLDVTVERDTRHGCPYKIVFDANGRRYIPLVRTVASKGHIVRYRLFLTPQDVIGSAQSFLKELCGAHYTISGSHYGLHASLG